MLICIPRQARGLLHRAVMAHPPSKPSRCVSAECAVWFPARCPIWIIRESLSENIMRQNRCTHPVTLPIFSLGVLRSDDEEVNPSLELSAEHRSAAAARLELAHLRLVLIWGFTPALMSFVLSEWPQAMFYLFTSMYQAACSFLSGTFIWSILSATSTQKYWDSISIS